MPRNHRIQGFTLIEILIVVAIIGILAAIALPNYSAYVRRSKATEATSTLANARVQIEQYYQDHLTYVGYDTASGTICGTSTKYFSYTCPTLAQTQYTLNAQGINGMANFQFQIDQSNNRSSQFDGTSGATCWLTAQGGSC